MCIIGMFMISRFVIQLLVYKKNSSTTSFFTRVLAGLRYLSYHGFRIEKLGWNSAPIGVLLLGAAGTVYFFCKLHGIWLEV